MPNTDAPAAPRNTEEQLVRHDRICARAATCDRLNSDGEPCRHGTPHAWDHGCEVGCHAKTPFGAVCVPNVKAEGAK
jgi:hypothetical protein